MKEETEKLLKKVTLNLSESQEMWLKSHDELYQYEKKWEETLKEYQDGLNRLKENYRIANEQYEEANRIYKETQKSNKEEIFKHMAKEFRKEQVLDSRKVREM